MPRVAKVHTGSQTYGPCPNWTFNTATNQISTPGFTYDAAGNLTSDGTHSYQWDAEGRIISVAYGASRALDFLQTVREVDAKRVALLGHSRLGKTALWASALDPRFALVIASCPGEGGASLARRNYGETIANLVEVFPYWFCANLRKFAPQVDQLPVDMHELIALSAPRPVYVTAAQEDQWADPKGEFLALVAAGPVYRLLGAQDLGADQMPPLNQPLLRTLAFHLREGKHAVTAFDWDQFLAFADLHLRRR